ncbi:Pre-mRNA-splicing factor 38 [Psidium guajava]|nr:Pre-mRNA-splicing factor 38 [Psidium guajava]
MVAKAMRGLARPRVENGADRGDNEKNWLRKARSVISGVFSGARLRLTCYSSAHGSKSALVDARGCIEAVAEHEKDDGLERTGLDLGELIYGSGRGGAGCLEGSVRSLPPSLKDVADSECREISERRGEKAGPYGQIVLSKRHQRAMLRLSTVFKKNPSVKLLDVEVGKSNGNSVNIGNEKRCTAGTPRSTIRARAVAWVLMKLQGAQQKMKVKTVCYKVSNPIKEEERHEEDEDEEVDLTDEEEEGGEVELCKKRILMGRRCKPLNCSGALQYDSNGILLPELLP